jgi:hypothetical protein
VNSVLDSTAMSKVIAAAYQAPAPTSHDDSVKFAIQTRSLCLQKRGIIVNEIGNRCIVEEQMAQTAMRSRVEGKSEAETLVSFGINADAPAIVQQIYAAPLAINKDEVKFAGFGIGMTCIKAETNPHKPACESQMKLASAVMSMRETGLSQSEVEARLAHNGSGDLSGNDVSEIVSAAYRAPLTVKPEDVTTVPSDSPFGHFVRELPDPMLAAYSFAQQTGRRCMTKDTRSKENL